jgi:hypothetical protein
MNKKLIEEALGWFIYGIYLGLMGCLGWFLATYWN